MELPADIGLLLERLRDGLLARGDLVGLYLYGSLTTGDFSPARSDIDVVVMLRRDPDQAAITELRQLHMTLAGSGGAAGRLHCLYVPVENAADPEPLRTYWYGDRMTQWQLKVMTQAELMSAGVALFGPWPPPGIEPVPRADAVLTTGDLITKSEAISRLADFGVPAALAQQVRRRRLGEDVTIGPVQRFLRARLVRRIMRRGVRRLTRLDPAAPPSGTNRRIMTG